jgi:hypothetical protein
VKSVEENKQLELLEKIIEIMNSEGVSKEIKERLIKANKEKFSLLNKESITEIVATVNEFVLFEDEEHNNSAKSLKNVENNKKLSDGFSTTFSSKNSNKMELSTNTVHLNSTVRKFPQDLASPNYKSITTSFGTTISKDSLRFKDPKFPYAKFAVDLTLSNRQIIKSFITELKLEGFSSRENESEDAVYAEKKNFDLFKSLLDCFRSGDDIRVNSKYTTLSLIISFSDTNKFERILEFAGLSGRKELISLVFENTIKKLKLFGKKIRPIRIQDVNIKCLYKPEKPNSSEHLPSIK